MPFTFTEKTGPGPMKLLNCLHTLDNNLVWFIVKTQTKTKLVADPFQEMMEKKSLYKKNMWYFTDFYMCWDKEPLIISQQY